MSAVLDPAPQQPVGPTLLARSQGGDRVALEQLLARNANRVFRWAVLLGLSAADAEDAAQEILATAARRIATCEAEAALSSWLFQITRRVVSNVRRGAWFRRMFKPKTGSEHAAAFESPTAADAEMELAVRRCFQKLNPMHAEVLLLGEVEGYTRPEMARMLGIAEGTVASRVRLAKDAFKKRWDDTLAEVEGGGA
ncbi:MAG TPA: RNA polymerase sigma factor [Myxococcales bacterium]